MAGAGAQDVCVKSEGSGAEGGAKAQPGWCGELGQNAEVGIRNLERAATFGSLVQRL